MSGAALDHTLLALERQAAVAAATATTAPPLTLADARRVKHELSAARVAHTGYDGAVVVRFQDGKTRVTKFRSQ